MSSIAKGETYAMQKRMAAKRARDKATRTKRVRQRSGWGQREREKEERWYLFIEEDEG